jgi:hypothetical protein
MANGFGGFGWCTVIGLLRPPELVSHWQVDAKDAPTPRSGHRMVIAGMLPLQDSTLLAGNGL